MRFVQRAADLIEDGNDAARRLRAVLADELLEVDAVEVLHRVVEHAVRRAAVVVDGHGVRVAQLRGDLHFALEPHEARFARTSGGAA